jgi:hypothetical protein
LARVFAAGDELPEGAVRGLVSGARSLSVATTIGARCGVIVGAQPGADVGE